MTFAGVPVSWRQLSGDDLAKVYAIMGRHDSDSVPLAVLFKLAGIRVIRKQDEGFLCAVRCKGEKKLHPVILTPEMLMPACDALGWLLEPGNLPVRLEVLRGATAVDADLHGVPFKDYITVENSFQGYMNSKDPRALSAVAAVLYPGADFSTPPEGVEVINLVNWCAQLKGMFAVMFPNFFRPGGEGGASSATMLEIMNNEIRALTGGDVTKEEQVFNTDCWRALTELDFKAREAEDFNRQMAKHKK